MKRLYLLIGIVFGFQSAWSQDEGFYSIHKEQSEQNKSIGFKPVQVYDFFNPRLRNRNFLMLSNS